MFYQEAGIGIEFDLHSSGQNKRFITDIPPHLGSPIDPGDFHVTVMYPEEIARSGLGEPEKAKLSEISSEILSRLGELSIIGRELSIIRNRLRPYKKFLGIEIDGEEAFCDEVRGAATPIINDRLGIRLADYLPKGYHASVAVREKGTHETIPYRRRFPESLTISGYSVGVKTVGFTTDGQPANYTNSCFRNRFRSKQQLGRVAS